MTWRGRLKQTGIVGSRGVSGLVAVGTMMRPDKIGPGILLLLVVVVFLLGCAPVPEDSRLSATVNQSTHRDVTATPAITVQSAETQPAVEREPPNPTTVPTATPSPTKEPPSIHNEPAAALQAAAQEWDAEFLLIDETNTGIWQFKGNALVHPLAVSVAGEKIYLIDSGRVLEFHRERPQEVRELLDSGDDVDGVRVLEPLDLALSGQELLVLDRAGDLYAYDLTAQSWRLARYDRPVETSSGHYFVALSADRSLGERSAAAALLETNYKFVQLIDGDANRIWRLPEERQVDLDMADGYVYVLHRALHEQGGGLSKYHETALIPAFAPRLSLEQPREVVLGPDGVYVIDQGGRRILLFDPEFGRLLRIMQPPQNEPITALGVDPDSGEMVLVAKDRIYWLQHPEIRQHIDSLPEQTGRLSHDEALLALLDEFVVPIGGSNITFRDFQLPGAPRHYRLGIHQGMDFYWQPGTKVRAAADGTVIRADLDYVEPTAAELALWSAAAEETGFTPPEILDKYMGRQVWIEHEPGIVTRYAHLRDIDPTIINGDFVERGQVIGEVGNSGSPGSLESETADAHLHFELWIEEGYLGRYLRPIETRDWVERLFPTSR